MKRGLAEEAPVEDRTAEPELEIDFPGEADAKRLGLVTIDQIVQTLADAIEHPPARSRVVEVPEIRQSRVA